MIFSLALYVFASLSSAIPLVQNTVEKRTAIGEGCSYCTPGPWITSAGKSQAKIKTHTELKLIACNSYEYFAVASSMRNP